MNPEDIRRFIEAYAPKKERTIVIVDFANVDKWDKTLGWSVGIQELAKLVKHFSYGDKALRRFYYGSDFGPKERGITLVPWSKGMLDRAHMNNFEVVTKRVKYIHNRDNSMGYDKKCDFDVEMAVDLIKLQDKYDCIILFSGDGDLVYALQYLKDTFGKSSYVFGARGHMGKEVVDAVSAGVIDKAFYAEDFKPRLERNRMKR